MPVGNGSLAREMLVVTDLVRQLVLFDRSRVAERLCRARCVLAFVNVSLNACLGFWF